TLTAIQGARTFAKDLYWEMVFFALLIGGIGGLNALKFAKILSGGLEALDMDSGFQTVFYIYMGSLATVAPPAIIWLVLRRSSERASQRQCGLRAAPAPPRPHTCYCRTSTIPSASPRRMATRPETPCCATWQMCCAPPCARVT